jgi:hypothetical protein
MDGRSVSLPVEVPRGPESHQVTVEAEGYQKLEVSIAGNSDRTLSVEMKKIARNQAQIPAASADKTDVKSHHRSEHRHGSPTFKGFTDL